MLKTFKVQSHANIPLAVESVISNADSFVMGWIQRVGYFVSSQFLRGILVKVLTIYLCAIEHAIC